jgi:hypothetical protein
MSKQTIKIWDHGDGDGGDEHLQLICAYIWQFFWSDLGTLSSLSDQLRGGEW